MSEKLKAELDKLAMRNCGYRLVWDKRMDKEFETNLRKGWDYLSVRICCHRCEKVTCGVLWFTKTGQIADSWGFMVFSDGPVCDICLGESKVSKVQIVEDSHWFDEVRDFFLDRLKSPHRERVAEWFEDRRTLGEDPWTALIELFILETYIK
jgi:hypothetical protein